MRAELLHPRDPEIQFNLACYEAQLGDLAAARNHLSRAFEIEPTLKLAALDDSDLEPLWAELADR